MANKYLDILSNKISINKNKLTLNISDLGLSNNTTYSVISDENVIKDLNNNSVTLPEFKFTTSFGSESDTEGTTLEFTAAVDANNLNLTDSTEVDVDTSNYIVNINGTDTDQAINSLTFATNDKIIIKKKDDVKYFPYFNFYNTNCVKSIDAPLPLISFDFTNDADNFTGYFMNCSNLTSIPADLFKYNTSVTIFNICFKGCTGLRSIPANLFRYNTNVIAFGSCFNGCSNITSALPELWVSHPSASHYQCFLNCTNASNYADAQVAGWA